jgi:hypothetical protein
MTDVDTPPEYGRIPETTRRYGLSRSRLYLLAGAGLVRFIKVGNATLVDLGSRLSGKLPARRDSPVESRLNQHRPERGGTRSGGS